MLWVIVLALCLWVFFVQIWLCFKTRVTHLRAIPGMVITGILALCCIGYAASGNTGNFSLIAVIEAVVLAILLVADGLGWLTYCVIRFIQKIRT